jgi:DNA-binding CsgD family transcriptional regulator/predicted negative regulator of RcsB-dependent stress response
VGEPWAAEHLRQAADRALRSGNPEAAIRYLARALREPLDRQERADVLLGLSRAQATIGEAAAEGHLREALALIDDPRDEALAHQTLGSVLYTRSDQAGAAEAFARALDALGESDDPLARDLHAAYFSAASLVPELAPRALEHIAPIMSRAPGGETTAERGALAGAAVHLAVSGAPRDQAIALAYRAWGDGQLLAEEGPDGWGWSLVTGAFGWTDECEASLKVSGLVMQEAARRGSLMAHATASFTAVQPTHMLGRLHEACAHAQTALAAREFGWRTYAAALTANYAAVLMDQGELGAAERELEAIEDPAYGTPAGRAWARATRGRLRLLQGRPQEALDDLCSAGELLGAIAGPNEWWTHWRTDAALAAHQLGHHDHAQDLLSRAAQIAQTTTTPTHLAHVLRARARLEPDDTIDLLEQAVEVLEGSQAVTELIRSRVELGAALRRGNRRSEARQLLSEAREQAHAIGAWAIEQQAAGELRVAGARPRRLSFSGADSLTASQRRVAEMAAQGLANREIAQALFVTPRTVEQHLYNAYKKLGIQSRAELARALDRTRS